MKIFECQSCGNALHFENSTCVDCGHRLGYIPDMFIMSTVEPDGARWRALADPSRLFLFCDNATVGVCNWLVPADEGETYCLSCRHTRLIPDLSAPPHHAAWAKLEQAKRQLFYSLTRWRLPLPDRTTDPEGGLAFEFLGDVRRPDGQVEPVLTGHDSGIITLNIAEADDAERESRRQAMGEPYRTLLGHFRHEIGHYYWDRLVRDTDRLERCRALFGDDRLDYGEALQRHYAEGPPADWPAHFISSYASSHAWEDFAETWAHYTHMVDALETAHSYGLVIRTRNHVAGLDAQFRFDPYIYGDIDDLIGSFVPMTVALNSLNRSMGQADLYPFVMPLPIVDKLGFIHDLIRDARSGTAATI